MSRHHPRRKIIVDGQEFHYIIGESRMVLESPTGKSIVPLSVFRDYYTLEKGRWKKTSDGMITPKDVAAYIKKIAA